MPSLRTRMKINALEEGIRRTNMELKDSKESKKVQSSLRKRLSKYERELAALTSTGGRRRSRRKRRGRRNA